MYYIPQPKHNDQVDILVYSVHGECVQVWWLWTMGWQHWSEEDCSWLECCHYVLLNHRVQLQRCTYHLLSVATE